MRRLTTLSLALLVLLATPLPAAAQDSFEQACPAEFTEAHGFTDLDGNVHEQAIECLYRSRLTAGTSADRYSPSAPLTRGQTAAFLARLHTSTGGHLPAGTGFDDTDGSVHADAIGRLAAAGVLTGYPDGTFRPEQPVTRAQLAAFVFRAHRHRTYIGGQAGGPDAFDDISGSAHRAAINALAELGLVAGLPDGRFMPDALVRRDQAASTVARFLEHLVAEGYSLPPGVACSDEWPPGDLAILAVLAPGEVEVEEVLVAVSRCSWMSFAGWRVENDRGDQIVVPEGMALHAGTVLSIRSGAGESNPPEAFGRRSEPMWRTGDTVRLFDPSGAEVARHRVGESYEVTVTVELVDATGPVPFTVTATDPGTVQQGEDTAHAVVFTGTDGTVLLHDPRFSGVLRDGDGQLVAAGRGCFPNYDEAQGEVFLVCTDDFQYLQVDQGGSAEAPVGLHTDPEHVGPRRLAPGSYVVEERVAWSRSMEGDVEGEVTVRVTYTVRGEEPQG